MKLFYEYIVIFFNLSPTSNYLHPLQGENCDSNSRLVVDEDDNGKFRLERVNHNGYKALYYNFFDHTHLCLTAANHNLEWIKNN